MAQSGEGARLPPSAESTIYIVSTASDTGMIFRLRGGAFCQS
ncbi:MAG: hypothetical protein R2865_14415 [Deinococcales bacterium]